MNPKKFFIACDWLDRYAGSERVIKAIAEVFKPRTVLTMANVMSQEDLSVMGLADVKIQDTFLKFLGKNFRYGLPLFPLAVRSLTDKVPPGSVIISSSHAAAKGISSKGCLHICYMQARNLRYVWNKKEIYPAWAGTAAKIFFNYLKTWDVESAQQPDYLVANSLFVADWIKKRYNREAAVIYPPVEIGHFDFRWPKEDFFIYAGRLVPYKRVDIIVEAFQKLKNKKLVIVGDGPQRKKLEIMAGTNVTFTGFLSIKETADLFNRAKCFINANVEDFGIALLEAQAAGCPVIALGEGGALETVIDGKTGLFFHEQSATALLDAVERFSQITPNLLPSDMRANAERFNPERFKRELKDFVDGKLLHWSA